MSDLREEEGLVAQTSRANVGRRRGKGRVDSQTARDFGNVAGYHDADEVEEARHKQHRDTERLMRQSGATRRTRHPGGYRRELVHERHVRVPGHDAESRPGNQRRRMAAVGERHRPVEFSVHHLHRRHDAARIEGPGPALDDHVVRVADDALSKASATAEVSAGPARRSAKRTLSGSPNSKSEAAWKRSPSRPNFSVHHATAAVASGTRISALSIALYPSHASGQPMSVTPPMTIPATIRSARSAAQATAYGPPDECPETTKRSTPIASASAWTSLVQSASDRPG